MNMNPYRTFHESYPYPDGGGGREHSAASPSNALRPTVDVRSASADTGRMTVESRNPVVFDCTSNDELQRLIQEFPVVVVDVWAPYCNPCKMLLPKYERIARKYEKQFQERRIIFLKDNIELNADIHKPHVRVVPTFFVYVHGQRYHISTFSEIEPTVESALNDTMAMRAP